MNQTPKGPNLTLFLALKVRVLSGMPSVDMSIEEYVPEVVELRVSPSEEEKKQASKQAINLFNMIARCPQFAVGTANESCLFASTCKQNRTSRESLRW